MAFGIKILINQQEETSHETVVTVTELDFGKSKFTNLVLRYYFWLPLYCPCCWSCNSANKPNRKSTLAPGFESEISWAHQAQRVQREEQAKGRRALRGETPRQEAYVRLGKYPDKFRFASDGRPGAQEMVQQRSCCL